MTRQLITQMLEALEWSFPNSTRLTQEHRAAITAAREYMAAPEQSEPEYWQWRRKTKPWEETYIFRHEQFATTDDSEVRKLYTHPAPQPTTPEPVNQMLLEALKLIASCESRVKGDVVDVARAAIAAAAQAPQPTYGWLIACDDAMITTHLGVAELSHSYEYAKKSLNELIDAAIAAKGEK